MNLEKLHVQNWGPHKDVTVDLNAPIVGIIGANGKGKSFLLQAISYAVTGTLPLAKEKYIREYDPSNEKRSGKGYKATVELHFSVGGDPGKIVRSISDSSSTRELHWKGEVYKKLADVDSIMEELLGADKAAMQNAVFIKQGELTEMVKGTPAVRQEIFRRLMNLNFLASRHEEVLSKLRLLEGMGRDVSGEIAQLEALLLEWEVELATHKAICAACGSAKDMHDMLSTYNKNNEYISMLITERKRQIESVDNSKELLIRTLGAEYDSIKDVSDALDKLTVREKELSELLEAVKTVHECNDTIATYANYKKHNDNIDEKTKGLSYDILDAASMYASLQLNINRAKADNKVAIENIGIYSEKLNTEKEQTDNLRCKIQQIADKIVAATNKLDMIHYHICIMNGHEPDAVCISCKRPIDAEHIKKIWGVDDIQEYLRDQYAITKREEFDLKEQLKSAKAELEISEKNLIDYESSMKSNVLKSVQLDKSVDEYKEAAAKLLEVNNIPSELIPSDSDDPDLFYLRIRSKREDYTSLDRSRYSTLFMDELAKKAEDAADQISKIKEEYPQLPDDSELLEMMLNGVQSDIGVLSEKLHKGNELEARIEQAQLSMQSYTENISAKEKEQKELQEKIAAGSAKFSDSVTDATDVESIVNQAYEKLQSSTQSIAFLEKTIQSNKEKLNELNEVHKTNAKIEQVQQELRDIKDILARDGLPTHYMQSVFSKITSRVQQILQQIGANFQVAIDETQPCTFTFYRTDTETEYVMPQEMLSGGQAVRLALALLLACQQLILPDVGLLVLDEPTSHVDQAGVESMRALFQEMSSLLANAGMQIVVVDHNADLQAGFTKTTVL